MLKLKTVALVSLIVASGASSLTSLAEGPSARHFSCEPRAGVSRNPVNGDDYSFLSKSLCNRYRDFDACRRDDRCVPLQVETRCTRHEAIASGMVDGRDYGYLQNGTVTPAD